VTVLRSVDGWQVWERAAGQDEMALALKCLLVATLLFWQGELPSRVGIFLSCLVLVFRCCIAGRLPHNICIRQSAAYFLLALRGANSSWEACCCCVMLHTCAVCHSFVHSDACAPHACDSAVQSWLMCVYRPCGG
jgi:hypothetical protein